MRLLLLLAFLLLLVVVHSHPSKRFEDNRLRSLVQRMLARMKNKHEGQDVQDEISTASDSSNADNSSKETTSEPTTVSPTTRGPSSGKRSEDDKSQLKRSSSDGSSENDSNWEPSIEDTCGIEVDFMKPVTPDEMGEVLNAVGKLASDVAMSLASYGEEMNQTAQPLHGRSLGDAVKGDETLFDNFLDLIDTAINKGMCQFVLMESLFDRIAYAGTVGFAESQCNEAHRMVAPLYRKTRREIYEKLTIDWLHEFGTSVNNDMSCIVSDMEELSNDLSLFMQLMDSPVSASLRVVQTRLATVMAYGSILESELRLFEQAVAMVGDVLNDVVAEPLSQPAPSGKSRRLKNNARRFLASRN